MKSQTVSNWRTRGSRAEPWLIDAMCTALQLEATPWLVRVLTEQAVDTRNRNVWTRMGKGLGYRMASVAAALMAPVGLLVQAVDGLHETTMPGVLPWGEVFSLAEALFGG